MNFLEKSQKDINDAMRSKDKDRLTVLRMVKGAMQLEKINNNKEMNEELFVETVGKQIKLRNDSIIEFRKGAREDLILQTEKEISILKEYLPEQLSDEELNSAIDNVIKKLNPTGPKEMGLVIKELALIVKGKADMKDVSNKVKEKLANL